MSTPDVTPERLEKLKTLVAMRQKDIVLVLEDIHDPHNAEATFRTCDAFGIQTAHLIFEQQPPFNPRKVGKSTSSSANKWIDFEIYRSTQDAISHLKQNGYTLIATSLRDDSVSIYDADFSHGKWAIWIGNEHRGLSELAQRHCDIAIKIPMSGLVQSLNLSVTAALLIFEISRQRHQSSSNFQLPPTEQTQLISQLIDRTYRKPEKNQILPGSVPTLGQFGPQE